MSLPLVELDEDDIPEDSELELDRLLSVVVIEVLLADVDAAKEVEVDIRLVVSPLEVDGMLLVETRLVELDRLDAVLVEVEDTAAELMLLLLGPLLEDELRDEEGLDFMLVVVDTLPMEAEPEENDRLVLGRMLIVEMKLVLEAVMVLVVTEFVKDELTEPFGVFIVDIVDDSDELELELKDEELARVLEPAVFDGKIELELLEIVPIPARIVVVPLALLLLDPELEVALENVVVGDRPLVEGLVLKDWDDIVLLVEDDDEPAIDEPCVLLDTPDVAESIVVVLPMMFDVVEILEVLLKAPLLDPVAGPETPVGVVHLHIWRARSIIVGRRPSEC